ncbi:MAG: AbrB/MazE/SpoVT family DNA-binding domain-containing protein [Candidatus Nanoarchaeia archaeon]
MKRKLIQLSTSTNVISLPTAWLKKQGLAKGDEINLEEKDNMLVVSKDAKKGRKKISLNISCLNITVNEKLVWMVFDAAYMSGYDEIILETKDQKQVDILEKVVRSYPGMIIYEEKKNYVHLKNIAVQEEFDLTQIISRIRNITISMLDDSIEGIKSKDWDVLINMKKRDYAINTYISLAFRHLNVYGYTPLNKQSAMAQYIKMLEMFSDGICTLLKNIGEKKQAEKKQLELLQSIRDLYREESQLISKFSLEKLNSFNDKRMKLQNRFNESDAKIRGEFSELVQLFFEIEEVAAQLNM